MTTEIWFRNPNNYIKELAEIGHTLIAWDRGILIKRRIDPFKFSQLYFGDDKEWRSLCVGNAGTVEVDQDHDEKHPKAVYPTWEYGEKMEILEEMMSTNIGDDPQACMDIKIPEEQRPVFGQEHRVLVTNLPNAQLGASRKFYIDLKELQEDYPDAILHLHGSYSFRMMFGMGYQAADYEPRTHAANKVCMLPTGKAVRTDEQMIRAAKWFHLLDYRVPDMRVPRNRCLYNISSALWASKNWEENVKFKTQGTALVNPAARTTSTPLGGKIYSGDPQPGDMINCDTCSLASSCKYAREGAVCSVPGSDGSTLANYFRSRDSNTIIEALGAIIGTQVKRTERAITEEEEVGELNPQVSRELNAIFSNGIKLAKLVDPSLTKPNVSINVGAGGTVSQAAPNQIVSQVVRTLESQGIKREDITPDMIRNTLAKMAGQPQQIEGKVIEG